MNACRPLLGACAAGVYIAHTLVSLDATTERWPQFRGPDASNVAESDKVPLVWSATENVAWSTEIPGRGWSSPIVWGQRVFLTSAVNSGSFKAPSTGIYGNDYAAELQKQGLSQDEVGKRVIARDIELTAEAQTVEWRVVALAVGSGKVLWQQTVHKGPPVGGRHRKNTYASETPVTDGERVYVYFGNVGLFAYSMAGALEWSKRWDPQPMYLDFGTASSPVLDAGRIYVQHDNEGRSFLAAVDAKTGKELWSVVRSENKFRMSGWATPFVWRHKRTEIVTVGQKAIISYDTSGQELWRMNGLVGQATPTPSATNDVLYVGAGSQGETNRPMYAIRAGASGDVTLPKDATSNDFVMWTHPAAAPYTSSPLVYRDRVYVVNDNGIFSAFDAKTGTVIYRARVGGSGHTFSSSPWASHGRIFCLSEEGETFVIEAGDEYKEVGRNALGEMSFATPAVAHDSLFIRTATKLYRIADRKRATP